MVLWHRYTGYMEDIPPFFPPSPHPQCGDLSYWLGLISDEIKRRDGAGEETLDCLFELHAVLETEVQKLRSAWYQ
jgi:hypothetical protein